MGGPNDAFLKVNSNERLLREELGDHGHHGCKRMESLIRRMDPGSAK